MKHTALTQDPGYGSLKQLVIERTGLAYYNDKDEDLAVRIARRLAARGAKDCAEYCKLLDDAEMDELIAEVTIGETYFFRQAEQFEGLREIVLPGLLEQNRASRCLRIWSAGCASGAEAYSVAMLLRGDFAHLVRGWDITILGTDINRRFLASAREGRFSEWAFREAPEDLKARYFIREGKRWAVRPELKAGVSFQYHNLMEGSLPLGEGAFDLILCRNVMIYFSAPLIKATADRLFRSLAEGGWLLVGHAEPNAEVFREFVTVMFHGNTLYQKPRAGIPEAAPEWAPVAPAVSLPAPAERARRQAAPPRPKAKRVARALTLAEVRALADQGQWPAAASACQSLLEVEKLNAALHFTMALILEHTGPPGEVEGYLRRAIYLDRGFALAHFHLGLVLQKRKQVAAARKAFENVLDLLAEAPGTAALEHGDEITAEELRDSAQLHLELLSNM